MWGQTVSGWTSLPESWDANGSYSLNHCMLGHIQEWFMQDVAGIAPARDATAFKSILIRPTPGPGVTSASGTYQGPYGPISTSWSLLEDGKKFTLDVKVPVNTSAQVRIPGAWAADVKESGMEASRAPGVEFVRLEQEGVIFKVGSGQYRFEADIRPAPRR